MAVKEIFRRMRPVQLYVMLALTILFFLTELVVSHFTHALTLLVDSYHMLCNLIALGGCIATVKYGGSGSDDSEGERIRRGCSRESCSGEELKSASKAVDGGGRRPDNVLKGCMGLGRCHGHSKDSVETMPGTKDGSSRLVSEKRLRNTFGWARIDVLVLLSGTVFLASLCFSLVVEALQTLFHIGHSDEMHHPIPVLCVGAAGILLNGLCYLLIGGYTFHQGSFLHVTSTGDVVLERAIPQDTVRQSKRLANTTSSKKLQNPLGNESCPGSEIADGPSAIVVAPQTSQPSPAAVATSYLQAGISGTPPLRQGPREMFRDVVGCILVIVCSLTVYFTDANIAKYVDPIISIFSAVLLLILSYPYMKESGLILLQTIPDHINIENLRSRLCYDFAPTVVGVHDLHIWRLTPQRTYATAHVVFINSKEISSVIKQVTEFFHDQGINHVTIQPEFLRCRAVSFQNGASEGLKSLENEGQMVKAAERKSFKIMMENQHPTNSEGVICFLQCAGRGGSCRNLHCCDEAKGEPLALPHHHHHPEARYRRRHSLDEVIEHNVSKVPLNPASSSSPSLDEKQQTPLKDEVISSRRAISDDAIEKSSALLNESINKRVVNNAAPLQLNETEVCDVGKELVKDTGNPREEFPEENKAIGPSEIESRTLLNGEVSVKLTEIECKSKDNENNKGD